MERNGIVDRKKHRARKAELSLLSPTPKKNPTDENFIFLQKFLVFYEY